MGIYMKIGFGIFPLRGSNIFLADYTDYFMIYKDFQYYFGRDYHIDTRMFDTNHALESRGALLLEGLFY